MGKRKISVIFAVTIFSLIVASETFAQGGMRWGGSGGWGRGSQYNRLYDPKTVETVSGEVVSVDKITPRKGMSYGVHLTLRSHNETMSIHLGPSWFIENQEIQIMPKDKIEVTGSRITYQGKPVIIAAEIKKGDEVLKLRDQNGSPMWAGWRKGGK